MPFPIALLKADEIIARLLACTIPITEIPDSLPPKLLPPPCLPPPSPTLFSLGPVAQPDTCNPPCLTPPSQSLHHLTWRLPASQSPSAPPPPPLLSHGPVGLVNVKDAAGVPIVKGKKVRGASSGQKGGRTKGGRVQRGHLLIHSGKEGVL